MVPSKMTAFCKHEDCPSSNELLDYQKGELLLTRGAAVVKHLEQCEFCEAEVEFYSHYPQEETSEASERVEIPAPLFELAEALLKKRHANADALNALLKEKGGLMLKKA